MSGRAHPGDSRDAASGGQPTRRGGDLRVAVVRYERRPDRCTVYPADSDGVERMSTWLSADADCFVSLSAMR